MKPPSKTTCPTSSQITGTLETKSARGLVRVVSSAF